MIKALIISLFFVAGQGEVKKVDVKESKIVWIGKKVTGQHDGTIQLKEGRLEWEDGNLIGGKFTMDMTTIKCLDLAGSSKEKLEGHLKSEDFFHVEKFPSAAFVITKAIAQEPGKYLVTGNITIKGTTEEIQFPATVEEKSGKVTATANITIDRTKFDVRYGSDTFFDNLGDRTIYDNFDLSVTLVAK